MDHLTAVSSLAALAQSARLAVFRRLVRAGPEGMCPSEGVYKFLVKLLSNRRASVSQTHASATCGRRSW